MYKGRCDIVMRRDSSRCMNTIETFNVKNSSPAVLYLFVITKVNLRTQYTRTQQYTKFRTLGASQGKKKAKFKHIIDYRPLHHKYTVNLLVVCSTSLASNIRF